MTEAYNEPLRFGSFIPPIIRPIYDPTSSFQRVLELVEFCDRIGFDEAWFGEHHNGGWEIVNSPEIMIASAIERTKNIKLGTGVTSLPYHHPLHVVQRMVMLDHLSRGRVILGAGPGSLAWDAHIHGMDYQGNRKRLGEALEAIMRLLRSDEPVTMETDWFKLVDAQLQVKPYTRPHFEVSAAGTASPAGPRLAGQHGISLLSIAASSPAGFEALAGTWEAVEKEAAEHGQTVDRSGWRLVSFYHIAETEAQAREDAKYGLLHLIDYFSKTTGLADSLSDIEDFDRTLDELNESGLMVIGTPDRLVEHIESFQKQTGGFGAFLGFGHEIADREATLKSHELVIRDVAPHFQQRTSRQQENFDRVTALRENWNSEVAQAQAKAAADWEAKQKGSQGS